MCVVDQSQSCIPKELITVKTVLTVVIVEVLFWKRAGLRSKEAQHRHRRQ